MKAKNKSEKGSLKLSKIFQKLEKGDRVAVTIDLSGKINFPKTIQGRTGVIENKRGSAYEVKIKDFNKEKTYIVKPVHLKKIK